MNALAPLISHPGNPGETMVECAMIMDGINFSLSCEGIPAKVDEMAILFATQAELAEFVRTAQTQGVDRFNHVPSDLMLRMDTEQEFMVRFEFLRTMANAPWRVEAMTVLGGMAPLHAMALSRNEGQPCIIHASYKLPSLDEYERHKRLLGMENMRAEYTNSYGRFAYFDVAPHMPFIKPRVNMRDL